MRRPRICLGVMLLMTAAVFADALVPNLQEKCLKELKYPVGRMIVYSNAGCAALVLLYCSDTVSCKHGFEMVCFQYGGQRVLVLAGLHVLYGLRCYLVVVKELSGVAGVVTTSLRKVVTLILSFLLAREVLYSKARAGPSLYYSRASAWRRIARQVK